ncbi:MAG: hypothetical protein E6J20_11325 [Chloroflexi bacterium]|nr:MAG: hypothetical protein E6J20_11325 [Chloroflexota bacterium]
MVAGPVASAASPSPSPSLNTVIASPAATGYADDTTTAIPIHGAFDLQEYVGFLSPADTSAADASLRRDGFVSGYAHSWIQKPSNHLLLELVVAFAGGEGARRWLTESAASDKASSHYVRAISMSGIDPYYGWHLADATGPDYADVISFVKGNDFFLVGVDSPADDLADSASGQARRQYDAAPPYSIPPSQWPEGDTTLSHGYNVALLAVLAGSIVVSAALVVRRARRPR